MIPHLLHLRMMIKGLICLNRSKRIKSMVIASLISVVIFSLMDATGVQAFIEDNVEKFFDSFVEKE